MPPTAPAKVADQLTRITQQMMRVAERMHRHDLLERLEDASKALRNLEVSVVVVGQFKQGKSSLINALVSAPVCPVDDVIATSVPTVVRWGAKAAATLITEFTGGQEAIRTEIELGNIREHVTELAGEAGLFGALRAEVTLPRTALAEGLVLIDTPGVGNASARASTNLTLLPQADAVVMVSDATQELTDAEIGFLRQSIQLCPRLTCVVSKSDLQHDWRRVIAADAEHLFDAGIEAPIVVTSALVHELGLHQRDPALLAEGHITDLAASLHDTVNVVLSERHRAIAVDIRNTGDLMEMVFTAELEVLTGSAQGSETIHDLKHAEETAEKLSLRSARWQQTLADGSSELIDDLEFDLRDRLRAVGREAEELIDASDPGRAWEDIGAWFAEAVTQAVSDNFVWAHTRSTHLAEVVAKHFSLDGAAALPELALPGAEQALSAVGSLEFVESGALSIGQKLMIGLKGSYGGVLMFGLLTSLAGMALVNPISVAAGLAMGGFAYRQEAKHRLEQRRGAAKAAVRKVIDEAVFQVSKESRNRLNTVKRVLRDHFISVAESFKQSLAESIRAAKRGSGLPPDERSVRARRISADLNSLRALCDSAENLTHAAAQTSSDSVAPASSRREAGNELEAGREAGTRVDDGNLQTVPGER